MQLLLQLGNASQFFRLVAPLGQAFANGFVNLQAFVEEDANQVIVGGLCNSLCDGCRLFVGCGCLVDGFRFFRWVFRFRGWYWLAREDGFNLGHQFCCRRAGFLGGNLFNHLRQSVVAGKQQIVHVAAGVQLAFGDFLEQIFKYVGQVANGIDARHPGTAFERVHIALQLCRHIAIVGVFTPGM